MPRATESSGRLAVIPNCYIQTSCGKICLRILPDISDSKGASYGSEVVIGRSSPLVTYSHSDANSLSTELHFMITTCEDIGDNLKYLRIIKSLVYPGASSGTAPYTPPPVSRFVCGKLLGTESDVGVCVVLKNYSVRFPTEVAWEAESDDPSYLPYRFSISCQWEVVYPCSKLPTNCMVCTSTDNYCPYISKV